MGTDVSGARVSLLINLPKTLSGQVRVYLRRGQMSMAEQFLHTAQISSCIEHVRGEAVTEFVGRQVRVETGASEVVFKPKLDRPG